ncbi:MAG: hypothetical protein KIS67_14905 [Verrucomicrobiae bacterium]|nr:hypothetical protein [Verrucomicrobiae bacterium]
MQPVLHFAAVTGVLMLAAPIGAGPAARSKPRQNRPDIPEVARQDAIHFTRYTENRGNLKPTAQLYPLKAGESRVANLEIQEGKLWKVVAATPLIEDEDNDHRQDQTWKAHFRVERWDERRVSTRGYSPKSTTRFISCEPPDRVTALTGQRSRKR